MTSEKPSDLLLLVEISLSQVHRMFTEMKDRLADVIQRHSLLAYKYSSIDEGPASGGKELHVFQRHVFDLPHWVDKEVLSTQELAEGCALKAALCEIEWGAARMRAIC